MEAPPEKPTDSDCCGSGCTPCVFDIYEKVLSQYNERMRSNCSNRRTRHDLLSPIKYKPFELRVAKALNKTSYLYTFAPKSDEGDLKGVLPYRPGQHLIMIDVKSNFDEGRASVSRAYTPISVSHDTLDCSIKLFVKLYEKGRMSSFLKDLRSADVIFLRGAFGDFKHERNAKYVMMCAGTGIAPMYPIIQTVLQDERDETLIRLCWACATLEDVVFREEIRDFCKYWNFKATIYLSRESETSVREAIKYGEDIRAQKITLDVVREQTTENDKILICGSEKFNVDVTDYAKRCGCKDLFVF